MENIGFVLYKKGKEPGTLLAKWNHSEDGSGTGIATGGSTDGFVGKYEIRYFNENGELMADRDLDIQKDGESYKITWSNEGKVTAVGTGMLVDDILTAGWKNI